MRSPKAFVRYAWAHLAVLLGVILYGAWVRISGSGAGCGAHWPTCNGEILPTDPSVATLIEYGHRASSGLLGLMAILLFVWALRADIPRRARVAAGVTLGFVSLEALLGAGLVLGGLVVNDASIARAVVISLHLVNTLILTAAATLTAAWGSGKNPGFKLGGRAGALLILAAVGTVLVCMAGAVTALGDTLFPPGAQAATAAVSAAMAAAPTHFLVRLRILHPALAVIVAIVLLVAAGFTRSTRTYPKVQRRALMLQIFVIVQVMAGIINIALDAPGWMQIVHLFLAQTVWIHLVLLAIEVPGEEAAVPGETTAAPAEIAVSPAPEALTT